MDFLNITVNYSGTISRYVSAANLMSTKLEKVVSTGMLDAVQGGPA